MLDYSNNEIGVILRNIRKKKGLRLEDVADENISSATLSNLERGISQVKIEKLNYVLEKYGIKLKEIPSLIREEQMLLEDLKLKMLSIESLQRKGKYDQADELLSSIEDGDDKPVAAEVKWLRGVNALFTKNYRKAEKEFTHAIRIASQNEMDTSNIEAFSFSDLGLCSYYQNDLQAALDYTNSGIDAFNPHGERKFLKYLLLRNKATFLERMGKVMEGLKVVEEVWDEIDQIDQLETRSSFYWLKSEFLRKSGALGDALQCAQEGIRFAAINSHHGLFDLWSVLGSIYTTREEWEKAENCFRIAMEISLEQSNRFVRASIQMGHLYIKQKQWTKAEATLSKAVQQAENFEIAYKVDGLLALGDLFFQQHNKYEAITYYRQAIELAHRFNYTEKEYKGWYWLAECYKGDNEEEFQCCTVNMFNVQQKIYRGAGEVVAID
ncbi:tetratricopeptide repeat protein [Marininema halotolerans]|uniref:Transcriptional regulator, contains XRE-family HTH domain n=1 Tax=Marininema halotolerans TaxID=1155944 RepID=A0A1I6RCS1_9BACL|nr:tetratricopeptide repeat protein [Marininema halotolerans]SFS62523.1 Transcriptional regulator, contains XRE-family HTH domain [Marininema halotolerans]